MKKILNLRSIALLGAAALITTISFAFRGDNTNAPKALNSTLYFRYTPPATGDYSPASVDNKANWNLVSQGEMCQTDEPDVACSFAISVPVGQENLFYDGSNHPSSRVEIQEAGTATEAYVSDVLDTNPAIPQSIQAGINNQEKP
jgi:hypothetical protein